jgi:hypothetical protein
LPELSPYELTSAPLPREIDRQRLREALLDQVVPKGPLVISNQLGKLGPILQALRELGADGYIVEEATGLERLQARIRGALGMELQEPHRARPQAASFSTAPGRGWQLVASIVVISTLAVAGYLVMRVKFAHDALQDAYSEGQSALRVSDLTRALKVGAPVAGKGDTPPAAADDSAPRGQPSAPARAFAPSARDVLDDAYLWLPLLLGVAMAFWLTRPVSNLVDGEPLTWIAVLARGFVVLVVAGGAVFVQSRPEALAGTPAPRSAPVVQAAPDSARVAPKAVASAAAALIDRIDAPMQERLNSLVGPDAQQMLQHTSASQSTGSAPARSRPFAGLLAKLVADKRANAATRRVSNAAKPNAPASTVAAQATSAEAPEARAAAAATATTSTATIAAAPTDVVLAAAPTASAPASLKDGAGPLAGSSGAVALSPSPQSASDATPSSMDQRKAGAGSAHSPVAQRAPLSRELQSSYAFGFGLVFALLIFSGRIGYKWYRRMAVG